MKNYRTELNQTDNLSHLMVRFLLQHDIQEAQREFLEYDDEFHESYLKLLEYKRWGKFPLRSNCNLFLFLTRCLRRLLRLYCFWFLDSLNVSYPQLSQFLKKKQTDQQKFINVLASTTQLASGIPDDALWFDDNSFSSFS